MQHLRHCLLPMNALGLKTGAAVGSSAHQTPDQQLSNLQNRHFTAQLHRPTGQSPK
jgi:hypothetical protein